MSGAINCSWVPDIANCVINESLKYWGAGVAQTPMGSAAYVRVVLWNLPLRIHTFCLERVH